MAAFSPAESNHAASETFIRLITNKAVEIFAPTLLFVEIGAAVMRRRQDADAGRAISDAVRKLGCIRWVILDDQVAQIATRLAIAHSLRGADAVYAAVATLDHCPLVSLDHEHFSRLAGFMTVLTPTTTIGTLLTS